MILPRLLQEKKTYTIDYPQAIKYAEEQAEIFWLPSEPDVEKDIHDLKTNTTEAEHHGVITTLKLFTLYELYVGNEYWANYVSTIFPRPDIQRMASCFSFFELNVHAPFYNRINEALGLDTDEFYSDYLNDPILKNRMEWIGRRTEKYDTIYDKLKSIGIFSMIEGAILYSSFAYLKHFQAEGKNKIVNVCAGINFSVNDENIHSEAGAWLTRTLLQEAIECDIISPREIKDLYEEFNEVAMTIREHESIINSKIFEKGAIKGITEVQLNNFVESRLDLCLNNLGGNAIFRPQYNPIAKWFYKNLNSSKLHDFFVKQGSDYNRNWSEKRFVW